MIKNSKTATCNIPFISFLQLQVNYTFWSKGTFFFWGAKEIRDYIKLPSIKEHICLYAKSWTQLGSSFNHALLKDNALKMSNSMSNRIPLPHNMPKRNKITTNQTQNVQNNIIAKIIWDRPGL